MNQENNTQTQGFTIVELTLAMTFITFLLLAIASTVMQIGNIYNKGMTLRAVDQAGRYITADIRNAIGQTRPFDAVDNIKGVDVDSSDGSTDDKDSGRLCTGQYTFVWNNSKSLETSLPMNKYDPLTSGTINSDKEIVFARVKDDGGNLCHRDLNQDINRDDTIELLSIDKDGEPEVIVHSLDIKRISNVANNTQALYSVKVVVGTSDTDAIDSISCKPPSNASSNQNYCAINEFEFTALTGSREDK